MAALKDIFTHPPVPQGALQQRLESEIATQIQNYSASLRYSTSLAEESHSHMWDVQVGRILHSMLRLANYSDESLTTHHRFFCESVSQLLGPNPSLYRHTRWKSFMTDDHTPVEFSWSWGASHTVPVVRYSVEPIGWLAGTLHDPYNGKASALCLGRTITLAPSLDLQLYRYFSKTLTANECDNASIEAIMSNPPSQTFIAFDLERDAVVVKYYFMPSLKAKAMGKSNLDLVEESILALPRHGATFYESLSELANYIRSHTPTKQLHVEIFAVDCVRPEESRMKIYVRSKEVTFDSMIEVMTLGGKARSFSDQTLASLWELWCASFGVLDTPGEMSKPLGSKDHRTGGLLYYFELQPGAAHPTSKVYLPVRHYAQNDEQIARGVSGFLHRRGKSLEAGQTYYNGVQRLCTHRALKDRLGFHTYISCAVKNDKLSINTYFNPEIFRRYGSASSLGHKCN